MGRTCITHERCEMHTKFWSETLKGRGHSEDLGVDGKIRLGKYSEKVCTGCNWLRIGTSGGLL